MYTHLDLKTNKCFDFCTKHSILEHLYSETFYQNQILKNIFKN